MSRQIRVVIVAMFTLGVTASLAHAQGPGMNPQMQQQLLQRFDKNGNGQLDPDEVQAMQQMRGGGMGMGGRPGGPGGQGGPGGGGGGQGGGGMMNPQMQQQMLLKFDQNGNGQLDPPERQAMQQYMQQMGMGGGGMGMGGMGMGGMGMGGRPGGAGGQGGGGMMNPQMQQRLLQMFDKNGNGQLDPDEKMAAMQYGQQMRGGMGGPPGAGGPPGGQGKMQAATVGATAKKGKQTTNAAQDKQLQLLRFDKNGNGKLEPDELKASRDAAKE